MNDQHDPWLRKYFWDVSAAVALLLGFTPLEEGNGSVTVTYPPHRPNDPHSRDWQAEALVIRDLAYQAIDAGALPAFGKKRERRVRPLEFLRWALAEGYPIPAAWHSCLRQTEPPPPATAQASPEPSQPSSAGKKPILEKRRDAIANILRVLKEIDPGFDPDHPPGQKGQFQAMCKFVYPAPGLFDVEAQSVDDAKSGLITFPPAAQLSDYYRKHQDRVKAALVPMKENSSHR